jgi:hypothetical protein
VAVPIETVANARTYQLKTTQHYAKILQKISNDMMILKENSKHTTNKASDKTN